MQNTLPSCTADVSAVLCWGYWERKKDIRDVKRHLMDCVVLLLLHIECTVIIALEWIFLKLLHSSVL